MKETWLIPLSLPFKGAEGGMAFETVTPSEGVMASVPFNASKEGVPLYFK